jgi:hypothetical protein
MTYYRENFTRLVVVGGTADSLEVPVHDLSSYSSIGSTSLEGLDLLDDFLPLLS